MKKYILQVLILLWVLECKAQQSDFLEYLSNFRDIELPFSMVDRKSRGAIFHPNDSTYEISKDLVKKFVYNDSVNEFILSYDYGFDYGVKYELNNNHVVLLKKWHDLGTTMYDFDLSEKILVVYSSHGKMLSSQTISKDNDAWISYVHFLSKEKINVQQVKIIDEDYNKPELNCEIEMLEYTIDSNGVIHKKRTESIKKGVVVWDEEIYDLKLKTE